MWDIVIRKPLYSGCHFTKAKEPLFSSKFRSEFSQKRLNERSTQVFDALPMSLWQQNSKTTNSRTTTIDRCVQNNDFLCVYHLQYKTHIKHPSFLAMTPLFYTYKNHPIRSQGFVIEWINRHPSFTQAASCFCSVQNRKKSLHRNFCL